MPHFSFTEIILIAIALLIFFGPSKLPELGTAFGKSIREFKKASRELTDAVSDEAAPEKK